MRMAKNPWCIDLSSSAFLGMRRGRESGVDKFVPGRCEFKYSGMMSWTVRIRAKCRTFCIAIRPWISYMSITQRLNLILTRVWGPLWQSSGSCLILYTHTEQLVSCCWLIKAQ